MKKRFLIVSILESITLAAVIAVSSGGSVKSLFKTSANLGSENTLELSTQKISTSTSSYTNEKIALITTSKGNPLTLKCSNVIKNDSGWQTILPGGYFYNPLLNTASYNKITGIESVILSFSLFLM